MASSSNHLRRRQIFYDFWPLPPFRRQFFITIRRQIWWIFDPSPPKTCRRLKWMVPNFANLIWPLGTKMLDILINKSYLSKVICDKPRHCCQYGDKVCSGGHCSRGCEGRCIPESWILDGEKDCDDGLDEKGMCCFVYCKVFITTLVLNTSLPIR